MQSSEVEDEFHVVCVYHTLSVNHLRFLVLMLKMDSYCIIPF